MLHFLNNLSWINCSVLGHITLALDCRFDHGPALRLSFRQLFTRINCDLPRRLPRYFSFIFSGYACFHLINESSRAVDRGVRYYSSSYSTISVSCRLFLKVCVEQVARAMIFIKAITCLGEWYFCDFNVSLSPDFPLKKLRGLHLIYECGDIVLPLVSIWRLLLFRKFDDVAIEKVGCRPRLH